MQELKILIVEDDEKVYTDIYKRNIEIFNTEEKEFQISDTWIQNKDEAIAVLKDPQNIFEGAIVDLDLTGSGGSDNSGNEVIKEIKNNLRFPTFVVTGTPHNISEELNEPNTLFDVYERDSVDIIETFNRFKSIQATGVLNLLNRNGQIEKLVQNIFWKHLSSSLENWIYDTKRNPSEKEDSLLRYTILHMLEYLDENKVHQSEFYITKPVKVILSTGDLVTHEGHRFVVLTPACDFVPRQKGGRNVRLAFLLKIIEFNNHFTTLEESIEKGSLSGTLKDKLVKVINNNKPYYHFIPKHSTLNAGIIDFQDKLSMPIEELEEKISSSEIERIATISMPFLKDLIERYSSYYARQGSPDFDPEEVINSIFKK